MSFVQLKFDAGDKTLTSDRLFYRQDIYADGAEHLK